MRVMSSFFDLAYGWFCLTCYKETNLKKSIVTPILLQENQAIKRQRLEGGRSRQILGVTGNSTSNFCSSTAKSYKERKDDIWEGTSNTICFNGGDDEVPVKH
ncbi:hypothetical protein Dimus_022499 [Dionaea muscipula]